MTRRISIPVDDSGRPYCPACGTILSRNALGAVPRVLRHRHAFEHGPDGWRCRHCELVTVRPTEDAGGPESRIVSGGQS